MRKENQKEIEIKNYLKETLIKYDSGIKEYLSSLGYEEDNDKSYNAYEILKRPNVSLKELLKILNVTKYNNDEITNAEIEIKYEGYIAKARREANKMKNLDNIKLHIEDYDKVDNLSLEARQKLNKIKPSTLGQASRISGINPSDLQVIAIYLKKNK